MPDPLLQGKKSNWLRGLFYCKKYTSAFICSVIFGSLSLSLLLSHPLSHPLSLSLPLTLSLTLSIAFSFSFFTKSTKHKKASLMKKVRIEVGRKKMFEWMAAVMVWRYRDGVTLPWWCDAAVMVWRYHDGVTLLWWPDVTEKVRQVTFMPSISVRLNMRLKLRWLRP